MRATWRATLHGFLMDEVPRTPAEEQVTVTAGGNQAVERRTTVAVDPLVARLLALAVVEGGWLSSLWSRRSGAG